MVWPKCATAVPYQVLPIAKRIMFQQCQQKETQPWRGLLRRFTTLADSHAAIASTNVQPRNFCHSIVRLSIVYIARTFGAVHCTIP